MQGCNPRFSFSWLLVRGDGQISIIHRHHNLLNMGETVLSNLLITSRILAVFFGVFEKIAYFCITNQLNVLKENGYEMDRRSIY